MARRKIKTRPDKHGVMIRLLPDELRRIEKFMAVNGIRKRSSAVMLLTFQRLNQVERADVCPAPPRRR